VASGCATPVRPCRTVARSTYVIQQVDAKSVACRWPARSTDDIEGGEAPGPASRAGRVGFGTLGDLLSRVVSKEEVAMARVSVASLSAQLKKLRDEVVPQGPQKIEPNRKDSTTIGVSDEDEQALSEMMQTLASQQNRRQSELLIQIDRALARLEREPDLVGLCEECEEEIDERRLTLRPYVTLCAECQASHDPKRNIARKNLTDYR
jgi:DnaK suppressor protein